MHLRRGAFPGLRIAFPQEFAAGGFNGVDGLMVYVESINDQTHRRFGVSRRERFEKVERAALKPLPTVEFDGGEWKNAKLHPDCYVAVEGDYYSAPHIHRHKTLRIKLTEHHV
jgi:hypothetical protein